MNEKWLINSIFLLRVLTIICALLISLKARKIILEKQPKFQSFYLLLIHVLYFVSFFGAILIDKIIAQQAIPKYLLYILIGDLVFLIIVLVINYTHKNTQN